MRAPATEPRPPPLTGQQEMELWLGASDAGSSFASEKQRQAAWIQHRDRLMALWGCHGRRPMAWWQYEAPPAMYHPGPDYEKSSLFEADLLTETERVELVANWRREFDRAQQPNFSHCLGPGKFLDGDAAREAHYRWADIPDTLVEAWSAERQQNQKESRPPERNR
jgi:hypothetical protein